MLVVAMAGTFASSLEAPLRAALRVPCDIFAAAETDIVAKLEHADVLVTMAFTRAMGAAARRLTLVQVPGAGLERIDRSALPPGAALANAYGHEVGIAEYALGAMLTLTREFVRLDAALRCGIWQSQWAIGAPPPPPWPELAGTTLGILGYGRIGRALARRARAFDMEVCAIRRDVARSAAEGLALLGGLEILAELLRRADYLVVALPATADTRGLIGEPQLAAMKRTAVLVNVARAEIVDEDALYRALADRVIAAAALDVWFRYPTDAGPTLPARRPFHELPNVLLTPHVSGWTEGMLRARVRVIADNIERVSRGERPENLVG
ncbi:MAG TPA: 2-hydroxyacid dehydrogenase [Methylomirabilota bacterium]